jgi:hypothetical protein
MRIWALNAGVQRPEREAYHSYLSGAEGGEWMGSSLHVNIRLSARCMSTLEIQLFYLSVKSDYNGLLFIWLWPCNDYWSYVTWKEVRIYQWERVWEEVILFQGLSYHTFRRTEENYKDASVRISAPLPPFPLEIQNMHLSSDSPTPGYYADPFGRMQWWPFCDGHCRVRRKDCNSWFSSCCLLGLFHVEMFNVLLKKHVVSWRDDNTHLPSRTPPPSILNLSKCVQ